MKHQSINVEFIIYNEFTDLPKEDLELFEKAKEVSLKAHAPYSQFHVGAAVRMSDGQIFEGTNMENASFPLCICAERMLLGSIHNRFLDSHVVAMAIAATSLKKSLDHIVAPCGLCRQAILEFQHKQNQKIRLLLQAPDRQVYALDDITTILPFSFTGDHF